MDVTDDGALTWVTPPNLFTVFLKSCTKTNARGRSRSFKGFMQVYQLQTENDAEETWKDLVCHLLGHLAEFMKPVSPQAAHGFDRSLRLTVDPPL